jgi:uncharacterized damage-inducible protein DinB
MSEITRIRDQFDRMIHSPAWHGPSFDEAIEGLTHEHAAARPASGHSIYELVHHVGAWIGECAHRASGRAPQAPDEGDFPAANITVSDAEWRRVRSEMKAACGRFRSVLDSLEESRLEERVRDAGAPDGGMTVYATLHGAIQHTAYHVGQILLLRRALGR